MMPDREKVISNLQGVYEYLRHFENTAKMGEWVADALALMKEQETANLYKCPNCGTWVSAENVVRCKDCVHWDKGHSEECDNSDSVCFHNGWCKPDWFCADGEQRG